MKCKQSGFTLIEIIVTVVIVAILSAMILTFLSDSLVKSSDPVKRFQKTTELHKIMANIMADYNKYPKWRSETPYAGNSFIVPTIRNGYYYTTSGGGTSGTNEPPIWPTPCDSCPSCSSCASCPSCASCLSSPCFSSCASCPSCATVSDGSVVPVVQWNWGGCLPSLATLQGSIGPENSEQNNAYGTYHVEKNRFVLFTSDSEVDDTTGKNKTLKVTITNAQGGTLTALFISN